MNSERLAAHHQMRSLMKQGLFIEALTLGKEALHNFGAHVLLRADLASCQYMVGDYQGYSRTTLDLHSDLSKLTNRLRPESLVGCSLALGKLLEELGRVYQAQKIYQTALTADFHGDQMEMLKAQYLRLHCLFPSTQESAEAYLICEQMRNASATLSFEIQLALFHADMYFLGLPSVGKKVENFLHHTNEPLYTQRLVVFDYLFECLRLEKIFLFQDQFLGKFDYWQCDSFEKALWDLYLQSKKESAIGEITLDRTGEMSPMSALRYLILVNKVFKASDLGYLAFKKMRLVLQTIEPKSRALLVKTWSTPVSEAQTLRLDLAASSIHSEHEVLALDESPTTLRLLEILSKQASLPVEEAIFELYQTDFDENSFHRLRMLIQRINKKMFAILDVNSMIIMKNMTLSLDHRITLRVSA